MEVQSLERREEIEGRGGETTKTKIREGGQVYMTMTALVGVNVQTWLRK